MLKFFDSMPDPWEIGSERLRAGDADGHQPCDMWGDGSYDLEVVRTIVRLNFEVYAIPYRDDMSLNEYLGGVNRIASINAERDIEAEIHIEEIVAALEYYER